MKNIVTIQEAQERLGIYILDVHEIHPFQTLTFYLDYGILKSRLDNKEINHDKN